MTLPTLPVITAGGLFAELARLGLDQAAPHMDCAARPPLFVAVSLWEASASAARGLNPDARRGHAEFPPEGPVEVRKVAETRLESNAADAAVE